MKLRFIRNIAIATVAVLALGSCREQIDEGARYTFTGHTIASFLEENEDVYSSFIEILTRGGRFSLMKAYGTYTCFAPTNDAIARYLFEQDSIYQASLVDDNPEDIVWTGVTSPELSELSDSMCKYFNVLSSQNSFRFRVAIDTPFPFCECKVTTTFLITQVFLQIFFTRFFQNFTYSSDFQRNKN